MGFLDGREPLFAARQRTGCIVDGHGDLLTGDIFCLDDGPRVLDCLEFDDQLRYLDGLDDAAFLAMDLEYRGAAELGAQFLDWYAEFTGDPAPPALRHHYIAYRAAVRAKVACLRSEQSDAAVRDEAQEEARRCRWCWTPRGPTLRTAQRPLNWPAMLMQSSLNCNAPQRPT